MVLSDFGFGQPEEGGSPHAGFHCKKSSLVLVFSNFTVNFQYTLQLRLAQSSSTNFSPCFGITATPNLHFHIIESSSFASFKAVGAPRHEVSVFPNGIYVKFSTS